MPRGTTVDLCYQKLKGKRGRASAAAICQASTGLALATGKPPKSRRQKARAKRLANRHI